MKLVSYRLANALLPLRLGALLEGDAVLDLAAAWSMYRAESGASALTELPSTMLEFLALGPDGLAAARALVAWAGNLTAPRGQPASEVRLGPPVPRPGKILCAGRNYAEHLAEGQRLWAGESQVKVSPFPMGFVKLATAVIGPEDPIVHPKATQKLDYELELAAVIGRRARNVSKDEALAYVAGYTIANDVSARDLQREEMRHQFLLLGKNFDTFCPLGPYLLTADEVPDPQQLQMELRVNGEVRQQASTGLMIFSTAEQIAHWSQMTLEPGDVILTGTPAGVAQARQPDPTPYFLKPGDVVEGTIAGLGMLRNPVVAEE